MILYTKTFTLGKGIRFSSYIKSLGEQNFSPYTLLIEEIAGTENYRIEIVLTDLMALRCIDNTFPNAILFSECIIQYSKGAREFTLQASIGAGPLFVVSLYVILICLTLSITFLALTKGISRDLFVFVIIIIAISAPLTSAYMRGKKFLGKIGSLAVELNKK